VHDRNKTQVYRADDYSKHGYNQAVNKTSSFKRADCSNWRDNVRTFNCYLWL